MVTFHKILNAPNSFEINHLNNRHHLNPNFKTKSTNKYTCFSLQYSTINQYWLEYSERTSQCPFGRCQPIGRDVRVVVCHHFYSSNVQIANQNHQNSRQFFFDRVSNITIEHTTIIWHIKLIFNYLARLRHMRRGEWPTFKKSLSQTHKIVCWSFSNNHYNFFSKSLRMISKHNNAASEIKRPLSQSNQTFWYGRGGVEGGYD